MPADSPWDSQTLYDVLHAVAQKRLAAEQQNVSMRPTDLAHEAWLRLERDAGVDVAERPLFRYQAARAMRRVLVDRARRRNASKRGGDHGRVTMHSEIAQQDDHTLDVLAVHEAIEELMATHPGDAELAEQIAFGDLTVKELAERLGRPEPEVAKRRRFLIGWLRERLRERA